MTVLRMGLLSGDESTLHGLHQWTHVVSRFYCFSKLTRLNVSSLFIHPVAVMT